MAKQDVWVWCATSHPNQTFRDDTTKELIRRLSITGDVKLQQYLTKGKKSVKVMYTTRSLVIAGGEKDREKGIEQLLLLNNLLQEGKDLYTHTGH
eukprot:7765218-Ditylum_brightwellii.AAC.1